MPIDRKIYFDSVRASLFGGSMSQSQVDGQNGLIDTAEAVVAEKLPWVVVDLRHLSYCMATTYHETDKKMQPIEEYGKGAGKPYGVPDPETGQTYYGRGFLMTTWRDNYARTDRELGLTGDRRTEWNAALMLDPDISARGMFEGMEEGWYRSDSHGRQTLVRYFNDTKDDAYGAREIVNGDKSTVPSWSNGVSIGNLIKGYHQKFLNALFTAYTEPAPAPTPDPEAKPMVVALTGVPSGVTVSVTIDGETVWNSAPA